MQHLGSDQATWVKITGSLYGVRTSPLTYPACPLERNGRTCNKKLQNNDDGTGEFHCEMCGQNSIPEYRYVLSCHLVDFEGGREHVSAFGDQGESLMKMPAGQAHEVGIVIAVLSFCIVKSSASVFPASVKKSAHQAQLVSLVSGLRNS